MKKLILTVLLTLMAGFTAFADMTFPVSSGIDLAKASDESMAEFASMVKDGYRMFDMGDLLTDAEEAEMQQRLENLRIAFGQDAAIVTVNNHTAGDDFESYCDLLYYKGGFGTGSDRDGSLLVVDLGTRDYMIYAQGGAMRYFTDSAIDQIANTYNGGFVPLLSAGDYYGAFYRYIESVDALYKQGVQKNQYNYDPVTGEKDPYYKKPFLKLWQIIVSLVMSLMSGLSPVNNVKRRYAMEDEKRAAQSVSKAYRAASSFVYDPAFSGSRVIDKNVRTAVIQRREPPKGPVGGAPFGGGQSTGHASMGGGQHTSGGGKF